MFLLILSNQLRTEITMYGFCPGYIVFAITAAFKESFLTVSEKFSKQSKVEFINLDRPNFRISVASVGNECEQASIVLFFFSAYKRSSFTIARTFCCFKFPVQGDQKNRTHKLFYYIYKNIWVLVFFWGGSPYINLKWIM